MTVRVDLGDGQSADLLEPREVTGAHQDLYLDALDEFEIAEAEAGKPEAGRDLRRGRMLREVLLKVVVTGWSLPYPVPVTAEVRKMVPAMITAAILDKADSTRAVLAGETAPDPKTVTGSSATSATTSPGTAPAPPQEQAGESSATAA